MPGSKPLLIILSFTLASLMPAGPSINKASAADPTRYALLADFDGWNFTTPPANPLLRSTFLFVGQSFVVTVIYNDTFFSHNLAYYFPGTPPEQVSLPLEENPSRLSHSGDVSPRAPFKSLNFTFQQHGLYEYYCEYHPLTMHGQVRVLKSPDINQDRTVNILDLVIVGGSFLATPSSPNWKPEADLNFDNVINILDLVIVAANIFRVL